MDDARKMLRELLAKATPAPWEWSHQRYAFERWVVRGPGDEYIARVNGLPESEANRELIVTLRNEAAALLDALDRADATLEAIQTMVNRSLDTAVDKVDSAEDMKEIDDFLRALKQEESGHG